MEKRSLEETSQMILGLLPASGIEIERITKLGRTTVRMHIHSLRDDNEIYISGWNPPTTRGKWIATYSAGNLPDAVLICKTDRANKRRAAIRAVANVPSDEHALSLNRARQNADRVAKSKIPSTWLSPLLQINKIASIPA